MQLGSLSRVLGYRIETRNRKHYGYALNASGGVKVFGDDRVIDAVFRQDGVIRVRTPEDLVSTADLAARTGPLRAGGVGVLSASGGACDLIADLGEVAGLRLPTPSRRTIDRLQALLPPYGHAQNPLDVTGGAVADMAVWRGGVEACAAGPGLGRGGGAAARRSPTRPASGSSASSRRCRGTASRSARRPSRPWGRRSPRPACGA